MHQGGEFIICNTGIIYILLTVEDVDLPCIWLSMYCFYIFWRFNKAAMGFTENVSAGGCTGNPETVKAYADLCAAGSRTW